MITRVLFSTSLLFALASPSVAADPTPADVRAALREATTFYQQHVARHGGYVYATSGDLKLREGEGIVGPDTIWVQPPGTPTVGEAFLDAYEATGDELHLAAAKAAGEALVRGQLESGGWEYRIEFGAERDKHYYRTTVDGKPREVKLPAKNGVKLPAGWETWRTRRINGNQTVLDDDTTQAATRFLCRLDHALAFKDERIHEAANYALRSLLAAQYPNGAWSANYDRFPKSPPSEQDYPVLKAGYFDDWPRAWPKDFTGCYVTNDDLFPDMLATLLRAHEVYGGQEYLSAARRAGDFLLLAQMPDPQPAWAQQYDRQMHPVWCRAFEPPAVTGDESQGILEALLILYQYTGDNKYLAPFPSAITYLRKSQLPGGKLARFYELKTNRPIYFTRNSGKHELTYSDDAIASGYSYVVESKLDRIEAAYISQKAMPTPPSMKSPPPKPSGKLTARARQALEALDERGAWIDKTRLKHHKLEPESGVIASATFADNMRALSDYLRAVPK